MVVIPRISRREIQNLTPWPGEVRAIPSAGRFDGCCCSSSGFEHPIDRFREGITRKTPRRENQLAVRMEVDETANPMGFARGEFGGEPVEGGVLGGVAWGDSAVGLPAGVGGGAA